MPANAPTPWRRLSGCDSATALAGATLSGKESPTQINATTTTTTADAPWAELERADHRARDHSFRSNHRPQHRPGTATVLPANLPGLQGCWLMTNGRCGSAAEERMVCRLTAGGEWIRTFGSVILIVLSKTGLSGPDQCTTGQKLNGFRRIPHFRQRHRQLATA